MNPSRPTSRAGRWRRALGITAIGALAFTVVAPAAHAAAEGFGDAPASHRSIVLLGDDPHEIFGDDPHEIFGDDPHEIFGDDPHEIFGDDPHEIFSVPVRGSLR